ncbi:MAG: CmcJ/NvfI family oxidoreductase [Pseudomonadales bacterium]
MSEINSETCDGVFHYMAASTTASLYRNGQVMMRRDADGNTAESSGVALEPHKMSVRNARLLAGDLAPTCATNGFELVAQPLADTSLDFTDHTQVVNDYYPQCAAVVEQITGAHAYAFDHNVRSATGKQERQRIAGGQQVQEPAHLVHGDYTLRSAPERLQQLTQPPSGNDTLLDVLQAGESLIADADAAGALADGGRYSIINVWRNIDPKPVATHPLALCDGQTVVPEDLIVFEIHYTDRIGENYFAKYSPRHEMYYDPALTRDEVVLIKQWDSAGGLARSQGRMGDAEAGGAPCSFNFHSAFEDPNSPPDAPDRWSIEVRCMVIYP